MTALTAERLAELRAAADEVQRDPIAYFVRLDSAAVLALLDEVEVARALVAQYGRGSAYEQLHSSFLASTTERRKFIQIAAAARRKEVAAEAERDRIGKQLHEAKQEWAERCKRQEAGLRAAEAERDDLRKQLDEAANVLVASGVEIGTLQIRAEKAEGALKQIATPPKFERGHPLWNNSATIAAAVDDELRRLENSEHYDCRVHDCSTAADRVSQAVTRIVDAAYAAGLKHGQTIALKALEAK